MAFRAPLLLLVSFCIASQIHAAPSGKFGRSQPWFETQLSRIVEAVSSFIGQNIDILGSSQTIVCQYSDETSSYSCCHKESTVCVVVTYVPSNDGLSVDVTFNGNVVYQKEIDISSFIGQNIDILGTSQTIVCQYSDETSSYSCCHKESTVCVVVTYVPSNDGLSVDVTFNGNVVYHREISAVLSFIDEIISIMGTSHTIVCQYSDETSSYSCCHKESAACVVVTYMPSNNGLSVDVTFKGGVVYQQEISFENSQSICLDSLQQACLHFYNIDWDNKKVKVCSRVDLNISQLSAQVDFGCFSLGPFVENEEIETSI